MSGAARGGHDDGYAGSRFRPARKDPLLQRIFPVAGDLAGYRSTARGDLIAALTVVVMESPREPAQTQSRPIWSMQTATARISASS